MVTLGMGDTLPLALKKQTARVTGLWGGPRGLHPAAPRR